MRSSARAGLGDGLAAIANASMHGNVQPCFGQCICRGYLFLWHHCPLACRQQQSSSCNSTLSPSAHDVKPLTKAIYSMGSGKVNTL